MIEEQLPADTETETLPAVIEYAPYPALNGKQVRMITEEQYRFIGYRLISDDDAAAVDKYNRICDCKSHHITVGRVQNWKKNSPEFLAEYNDRWPKNVRANADRQSAHILPSAISILAQGLEAQLSTGLPDWRNRMKAVEIVARLNGMLKDKVEIKPDMSNLADDEVLRLEMLLERITANRQG